MAKIGDQGQRPEQMVRRGRGQDHAVKDVSFEAYFGEMLYVVGPSGSGKTTMLSMISGILRPNAGTVKIEGTDIWRLTNDALAEFPAAQDRVRLPGLPSVSPPHYGGERRHPADPAEARLGRIDRGGEADLEIVGLEGPRATPAGQAERRRAAASRDRAGHRQPPRHPDLRRAHGIARRRHRAQHRELRAQEHSQRQALHRHRHPRHPHLRIRRPHHAAWKTAN